MEQSNPVTIVIPYLPAGAQGREIEYAVAGWLRHFKHPHRIVIVGEGLLVLPRWIQEHHHVFLAESPRVPAILDQYRQHLDYVSCFRKVRAMFPESTGFIFVADDCYAVNDFDLADVQFFKMQEPTLNFDIHSTNAWRRDKAKTRFALQAEGYPTRNFTTHLPQWFEWDAIESLWERFHMDRESYVIEDLYFNIYYQDRIPFQLDRWRDNLKLGVYTKDPDPAELARALYHKIWITNSPEGWVPALENLLKLHFELDEIGH